MGCAGEIDRARALDSASGEATDTRRGSDARNGASGDTTNACEREASWSARSDLAFERTFGAFSAELNELVRKNDDASIAVSSHEDPSCAWKVAFSAVSPTHETELHAASFAPMLRHPAGLWTASPQAIGWMRIVDAANQVVWLPLADVTGSATYEQACASLASVEVAATIPPSAGNLSIATPAGGRTIRELMGVEPSARGWDVRFAFSAESR